MIGELSALTAAALWSSGSVLFTNAAQKIGSVQLNIDRMGLASIFLAITIGGLILTTGFPIHVTQYQFWLLVVSGFIGLVIGDTFLFSAFKEMGPRISLLIYSLNPALAVVMAYFILGERLSYVNLTGIFVTLFGIAFVVLEKRGADNGMFKVTMKSIFAAFMSAVGQSTGLIFGKMALMQGEIHSLTATFIRIFSAVVILLPMAIIFKKYKNPVKLYPADKGTMVRVGIGSVIGPYLGIFLSFIALQNTSVGVASTLLSTVPIMILPISYFAYKEKLTYRSVTGAVIAFVGVTMLFMNDEMIKNVLGSLK